jgi:two-component system LytT family response regulator
MPLAQQVRVVIVDDQPAICRDAEALIRKRTDFVVVGTTGSVKEALVVIPATKPDLLLLDIRLKDGLGFDILDAIDVNSLKVIFLTAYEEHAIQAIKIGALDYLLKPLDESELNNALDKVLKRPADLVKKFPIVHSEYKRQIDRIILSSQQELLVVEFNEIVYCQGNAGYTTFHLSNGKQIVTSKYLKEYELDLPASRFIRSHQSFIVNSSFISSYRKEGYLVLKNKVEIPVSVRKRETIMEMLKGSR